MWSDDLTGQFSILSSDRDGDATFAFDRYRAGFDLVDDERLDAVRCQVRPGDLGLPETGVRRHHHGLGMRV